MSTGQANNHLFASPLRAVLIWLQIVVQFNKLIPPTWTFQNKRNNDSGNTAKRVHRTTTGHPTSGGTDRTECELCSLVGVMKSPLMAIQSKCSRRNDQRTTRRGVRATHHDRFWLGPLLAQVQTNRLATTISAQVITIGGRFIDHRVSLATSHKLNHHNHWIIISIGSVHLQPPPPLLSSFLVHQSEDLDRGWERREISITFIWVVNMTMWRN